MYGYWISKKEMIPVEEYEGHEDKAIEIIQELFKGSLKLDHIIPNKYSIYRVMLRLGYIRIIYLEDQDTIAADYYHKIKYSKFQKECVKELNADIYYQFIYNHEMSYVNKLNQGYIK